MKSMLNICVRKVGRSIRTKVRFGMENIYFKNPDTLNIGQEYYFIESYRENMKEEWNVVVFLSYTSNPYQVIIKYKNTIMKVYRDCLNEIIHIG